MSGENEREQDEQDEREEQGDHALEGEGEAAQASEAPDPNVPRNRAERRAMAKAARRGRTAQLSDEGAGATPATDDTSGDPLLGQNTSIGGDTPALVDSVRRPKVPPRTISKGTGNADGVPEWALHAGDWFTRNRAKVLNGTLAVLIVGGAIFGWQAFNGSRQARATNTFSDALQASFAIITPEEPAADDPRHDVPHYRSLEDRNRATLEKLHRAMQGNESARVAPLVRLTEAGTLYQMGRYAEAKNAYLAALGGDLAGLEGRAIEGLGFTLESLNDLDGAMTRFRELQNIQDGVYRDQAQFYQARVLVRRNDAARAKDLLHGVIERTGHPSAADPTAAFMSSLKEQALALLRDIDPADPAVVAADRQREASGDSHEHGGGRPGGDPLQGLPPELRQQLEKALRERGGAGGQR